MSISDVLIIGGGPAGLNAALILGRCRRRVILCDAGQPRNAVSRGVNGFLTRDGVKPDEMRRLAREQLAAYPNVELREGEVVDARGVDEAFEVTLAGGERLRGRKLLIATGVVEGLPEVEGASELYGRGVYNCPYCDGYEHRDQAIAVYGRGQGGANFALELLTWSRDIVLCTDGPHELSDDDRGRLERNGVPVVETSIASLEGADGELRTIRFADGESLPRSALFFIQGECDVSELVTKLGCDLSRKGTVETNTYEKTNVPGVYVAGDASRRVQFAIVAAAEGALAAFAINTELAEEQLA